METSDILNFRNEKERQQFIDDVELEKIKDFFGTTIEVGERAIRVHSFGHWKEFKKVTIEKIDLSRDKDIIGVITDGNTKIGWTYPGRIIVQNSLKIKI